MKKRTLRTQQHPPKKRLSACSRLVSLLLGSWYGLALVFLIALFLLLVMLAIVVLQSSPSIARLQRSSDLSWLEIVSLAKVAVTTAPKWQTKTILLLGTDELDTRGNQTPLTDTILLVSFNPFQSAISLLPIPRDVWIDKEGTKINALYAQTLKTSSPHTQKALTHTFSQLFDIPIDQTLVVSMDLVKELIDAVGGVSIDVPTSFTDYTFPRMDVDVTKETDPSILYETVTFTKGDAHMDGTTALKYMRSRHSQGTEGNDMARSRRQQQVIVALIEKTKQAVSDHSVPTLIQLLNVYTKQLDAQFPVLAATKFVTELPGNPSAYTFHSVALPIQPTSSSGVLIHPTKHVSGQWVFVMTSLDDFQLEIKRQLHIQPQKVP